MQYMRRYEEKPSTVKWSNVKWRGHPTRSNGVSDTTIQGIVQGANRMLCGDLLSHHPGGMFQDQ